MEQTIGAKIKTTKDKYFTKAKVVNSSGQYPDLYINNIHFLGYSRNVYILKKFYIKNSSKSLAKRYLCIRITLISMPAMAWYSVLTGVGEKKTSF